eukprot:6195235-Pleurochrysis_carterae.AAC.3
MERAVNVQREVEKWRGGEWNGGREGREKEVSEKTERGLSSSDGGRAEGRDSIGTGSGREKREEASEREEWIAEWMDESMEGAG